MLSKLINWLSDAQNILILFHESPDGDAVASSLALAVALEASGKKVDCACPDTVPDVFRFLPGVERVKQDFILGDYDVVCTVDCGDARRTGFPDRLRGYANKNRKLINIDHHLKNDLHKVANLNFVNEKAAASAELVYEVIEALKVPIDRQMATLLLTGLYTDTGGFQHSNTCPRVYGLASKLLARGAQLNKISNNIVLNKKLPALRLWGLAMSRVRRNKYGIVVTYVTQKDFEDLGATTDDLAGVVNVINSIPEAVAVMLFAEQGDGSIKTSVRTENNDIDISKIARLFGGGGHKKASGFSLLGKIIAGEKGSWSVDLTG